MSKVTATFNGFVGHEGVPVQLHSGDEYDSAHPLVKAHPDRFTEPEVEVEEAPKAPAKTTTKAAASKPGAKDG